MTLTTKLDAISKRAEAATEGPWQFNASLYTDARIWVVPNDSGLIIKAEDAKLYGTMGDNAKFIAHARQDVPALVEALRVMFEGLEKSCQCQEYAHNNGKGGMRMERLKCAACNALTQASNALGADNES